MITDMSVFISLDLRELRIFNRLGILMVEINRVKVYNIISHRGVSSKGVKIIWETRIFKDA